MVEIKKHGTRAEVLHGKAESTRHGLTIKDIVKNKYGYIVSLRKQRRSKDCSKNPLCKGGHLQKKGSGTFGSAKSESSNKSISKNKSSKRKKSISKNKSSKRKKSSNKKKSGKKKQETSLFGLFGL